MINMFKDVRKDVLKELKKKFTKTDNAKKVEIIKII